MRSVSVLFFFTFVSKIWTLQSESGSLKETLPKGKEEPREEIVWGWGGELGDCFFITRWPDTNVAEETKKSQINSNKGALQKLKFFI